MVVEVVGSIRGGRLVVARYRIGSRRRRRRKGSQRKGCGRGRVAVDVG